MIAGLAVVSLALVLSAFLTFLSPLSERWVVKNLGKHYHAVVQLRRFDISLFPRITVTGTGLVLRPKNPPNGAPLTTLRQFSMGTSWIGLLRHPAHVQYVRLAGLTINIFPHSSQGKTQPAIPKKKRKHSLPPFYFAKVFADGTFLNIFSSNPQKPPRVFAISKLRLQSVAMGKPMAFQAILTNPKPIGQIQTTGQFGPWNPDDPDLTPVSGAYAFQNADLSTIRGLTGILSSRGKYSGQLEQINVQGETDTPQFGLGIGRNRMDLKTQFRAVVDGLNGDTLLRPVKAWLGGSLIVAHGGVLRTTGVKGETISLVVTTDYAQLADIIGIAVKSSTAPLVGRVTIDTRFDLPPGHQDIADRLQLNGNFIIQSAHFTNPDVEQKMTHLSERGEGKPGQKGSPAVLNLKGHFALSGGVMSFSQLSFDVPGASVNLRGKYGLTAENLDFTGVLRLKAKLSQTTRGIRALLLRPLDPLFKGKNAGTVIPIKITGTRQHVSFGIQLGKVFRRFR
jgi:hypothetical protein